MAAKQLVTVTTDAMGDMVVHRTGCQHLSRLSANSDYTEQMSVGTLVEVSKIVYSDMIRESDESDPALSFATSIGVAPCIKLPLTDTDTGTATPEREYTLTYHLPLGQSFDPSQFAPSATATTEGEVVVVTERGTIEGSKVFIDGVRYSLGTLLDLPTFHSLARV